MIKLLADVIAGRFNELGFRVIRYNNSIGENFTVCYPTGSYMCTSVFVDDRVEIRGLCIDGVEFSCFAFKLELLTDVDILVGVILCKVYKYG